MLGKFVKVPEGRGQLGVQAPFVVLVQGRCHVMYQEVPIGSDAEAGARQQSRGRGDRDARRSSLGSMKLLGSGAPCGRLLAQCVTSFPRISTSAMSLSRHIAPGPVSKMLFSIMRSECDCAGGVRESPNSFV